MLAACVLLSALLLGGQAFTIYSAELSLCLEETAAAGRVALRRCDLASASQQWAWSHEGALVSAASSRCLAAARRRPLGTRPCDGAGPEVAWDCDRDRLVSRSASALLSVDGRRRLTLVGGGGSGGGESRWKSLERGDICREKVERSRRSSDYPEEFPAEDEQISMSEEQREYLRWFYRTEDPTIWKFVVLGVAFVCLLVGFLLLGMGAMANRSRSEIAKYKAAAAKAQRSEGEELLVVSSPGDDGDCKAPQEEKTPPSNGEASEPKAGDIVLTWKDGNTSSLFTEKVADEHKEAPPAAAAAAEEEKEEKEEKEETEITTE